jgi:hypothetical protein
LIQDIKGQSMTLSADDWVQVRSKEEILATLDANGRLEGLPFMPQMFKYCGQRFQVYKRAHKTCDTVTGYTTNEWLGRRLPNAVHLDLRCDGQAHGGCQAACLIFWKEAWLAPVAANSAMPSESDRPIVPIAAGCSEREVWDATRSPDQIAGKGTRYACQATELPSYTQPLKWWDARQYAEDIASGNISPARMFRGLLYFAFVGTTMARRPRLGRPARWVYDRFQSLWGGVPFPRRRGDLETDKDAPIADLGLQPGDMVRVRPHKEILATIDKRTNNRGMGFDAEMVPFCGKVFRVRTRVEKFIDERTGYIKRMKTPAVILDGVYCQSRYSENRLFCPRGIFAWWREVWLEKVPAEAVGGMSAEAKVDIPRRAAG